MGFRDIALFFEDGLALCAHYEVYEFLGYIGKLSFGLVAYNEGTLQTIGAVENVGFVGVNAVVLNGLYGSVYRAERDIAYCVTSFVVGDKLRDFAGGTVLREALQHLQNRCAYPSLLHGRVRI